jgi:pimeloyl-ACP methyl ester carboxylesterase
VKPTISVALQAWRDGGEFLELRGHRLFARHEGDAQAPVLLLLHGFPTASFDWQPLWAPLRARFRVVTLDFLGFGFSAKPRAHDYSLFEQTDLVEALLARLGVNRYHVLAHDYGVTVAEELLARAIERDTPSPDSGPLSVVMLNGGIFPEAQRPRLIQKLLASPIGFLVAGLMREALFRRSFAAIFGPDTPASPALLDDCWALVSHDHGHRIAHRVGRYLHERKRWRDRWVGALCAWRGPKHLIDGTADAISGASIVARWRELIGAASVTELPRIGHYPQCEAPREVLAALERFWVDVARA